ncbi:alanine/glycine:cation symporter family protein [Rothia uropygialis]|uniref:alanine/glycine:cation symporter family protein n=1 Tax=Kocuria sp. 36 TaxID=1415402 RepID=UPI00101E18D8|nr:sodium:alanine symporter family protein [Kocuria sp. 36]
MEQISSIVNAVDSFVWGPWLLLPLLLGTGVFLTFRLSGVQFRYFGKAMSLAFGRRSRQSGEKGEISSYQAMATALGATVGTGNIVGVALSIHMGGPGALFWMWVTALVGMASKYSECFLGVRFRTRDKKGELTGGPQVYLVRGIPNRFGWLLSVAFAACAVVATFGVGNMTQSNAIAANLDNTFSVAPWVTAVVIGIMTLIALLGGIKSISKITVFCVPLMIALYVFGGLYIIGVNYEGIPQAITLIFGNALTPHGVGGGIVGSLLMTIQIGVARSLFSNESGMGTASIPSSIAQTSHPVRQGLVSMTQTFVDTLVVISITGFVIITTGVWEKDDPDVMTSHAFATGLPGNWGGVVVTICLVLLGYSTVLGWAYYGERCIERLGGGTFGITTYRVIFAIACGFGAVAPLTLVWKFSDVMNGIMAIPNLIGLIILSGLVVRETRHYLRHDPNFEASTAEIDEFMGSDLGALDAQIDHQVDLSQKHSSLSHPGGPEEKSEEPAGVRGG